MAPSLEVAFCKVKRLSAKSGLVVPSWRNEIRAGLNFRYLDRSEGGVEWVKAEAEPPHSKWNGLGGRIGGEGEVGGEEEDEGGDDADGGGGEEIVEGDGGHGDEPEGVDEGHTFEEGGAFVGKGEAEDAEAQGPKGEGYAEAAEQLPHAAHGTHQIEFVVGQQVDELFLGVVGGNEFFEERDGVDAGEEK
jgi:hypothetical protein